MDAGDNGDRFKGIVRNPNAQKGNPSWQIRANPAQNETRKRKILSLKVSLVSLKGNAYANLLTMSTKQGTAVNR